MVNHKKEDSQRHCFMFNFDDLDLDDAEFDYSEQISSNTPSKPSPITKSANAPAKRSKDILSWSIADKLQIKPSSSPVSSVDKFNLRGSASRKTADEIIGSSSRIGKTTSSNNTSSSRTGFNITSSFENDLGTSSESDYSPKLKSSTKAILDSPSRSGIKDSRTFGSSNGRNLSLTSDSRFGSLELDSRQSSTSKPRVEQRPQTSIQRSKESNSELTSSASRLGIRPTFVDDPSSASEGN